MKVHEVIKRFKGFVARTVDASDREAFLYAITLMWREVDVYQIVADALGIDREEARKMVMGRAYADVHQESKDPYQTLANALGIARIQAKKLILERVNLEGRMLDAFIAGWELARSRGGPYEDRAVFDRWAEGYWSDDRRKDDKP